MPNPFDTLNRPNQGLPPQAPTMGMPQGMQPQTPNPMMMQMMQQMAMQGELMKPGYTKGLPTEAYNLLDPAEQQSVMQASPRVMIEVHKDLIGDESFLNASKKGDMPAVMSRIRKYLELYRLTGLETNKMTGEQMR